MTAGDAERNRFPITDAVELVTLQPQFAALMPGHVAIDTIADFLGSAFDEVMQVLDEQDLTPAGPPFARWKPRADGFDAEAGFPSTGPITRPGGSNLRCCQADRRQQPSTAGTTPASEQPTASSTTGSQATGTW